MYQVCRYSYREIQVHRMFHPDIPLKGILMHRTYQQLPKRKEVNRLIQERANLIRAIIYRNKVQQFINLKFYYENLSKRVTQSSALKKKTSKKVKVNDPKTALVKVLNFKVQGYQKKLILLRQKKIKKNTYLRMFISKVPSLQQVYDLILIGAKKLFYFSKQMIDYLAHNRISIEIQSQMRRFSFITSFIFSCGYYLRMTGLKIKFLWDTLNHYLLLQYILRLLWRERKIVTFGLSLMSYSLYFRDTYFINYQTQKILFQELSKEYDFKIRKTVKHNVNTHVFGNEALPPKIAPTLIELVQQPKIKILMTDLFIKLLHQQGFIVDTNKLISKIIHDYLNSEDCHRKFTNLIIEQVMRNSETILPGMFRLLTNYLLGDNRESLTKQSEDLLIAILKINAVERSGIENIIRETQNSFDSPAVYRAAVNAALNTLQAQKK